MDQLLELCNNAKFAFELRANGNHLTPLSPFSELQGKIATWQDYNFGATPAWQKAMGIAEEIFELCDAINSPSELSATERAEILDATADIAIYSLSFCTSLRVEYNVIFRLTPVPDFKPTGRIDRDLKEAAIRIGSAAKPIAHAVLKNAQGIRGFDDQIKFVSHAVLGIGSVARATELVTRLLGSDFESVVRGVAENVLKRDWRKHPVTAAAEVLNVSRKE